jgi:hypothetical protein
MVIGMSMRRTVSVTAAIVLLGGPVAAAPAPAIPAAATAPPAAPIDDAQIVAVLATIHASQLDAARLAGASASDRRVRALAGATAQRARIARKREAKLRAQLGRRAAASLVDDALKITTRQAFAGLEERGRGPAFDRGWLEGQIQALTLIIDAINNETLPYARSPALRAELEAVVGQAGRDLAAAQGLLAGFGSS